MYSFIFENVFPIEYINDNLRLLLKYVVYRNVSLININLSSTII